MQIKKVLPKIGIALIALLILFGGCIIYRAIDDHTIYSIKTINQSKHKLTVYVEDGMTGNAANLASIEVIQEIGFAGEAGYTEKKITHKKADKNGIAVFRLPPGIYRCRGKGDSSGYTDSINLNSDKEINIEIVTLVQ